MKTRTIMAWLMGPSVQCGCGGHVVAYGHGWAPHDHLLCQTCGQEMDEAEYEQRRAR